MLVILDSAPQGPDAMALLREAARDARALYPELFVGAPAEPANQALPDRGVYVVAYLAGQPLACGSFVPRASDTAEVRRMYVHREHRRRGLAVAVLRHLVARARDLGFRRLILETGYKQEPAMRLYEREGFKRIAPFGRYVDDPSGVCYEMLLSG